MSLMHSLFNIVEEGFLGYLFLFPLLLGTEVLLYFYYKTKNTPASIGFLIGWQVFAGFLLFIFYITGTAGISEILQNGITFRPTEINLIPFSDGKTALPGLIMNCLLFLPVGVIIPLLWKQDDSLKRTVLTGFLLSFLIEISQLFNYRATDIDDLIMNTLGTALGFEIYQLLFQNCNLFCIRTKTENYSNGTFASCFSMLILFLLYFFIGDAHLNLIYQLYYGA